MTEEQLKEIRRAVMDEPIGHVQMQSKWFSPDRRLISSHHRSGKKDNLNKKEEPR